MKSVIILVAIVSFACGSVLRVENAAQCGLPKIKPDTSTSISGGKDAIPYSWPWMILLYKGTNANGLGHCGGTLISENWAMTAGHCAAPGDTLTIKAGSFNRYGDKNKEPSVQVVRVAEVRRHPKYRLEQNIAYWDISLLKLQNPVQLTDQVSPVCLPRVQNSSAPREATPLFLTGWGSTERENLGTKLQQVRAPVYSQEKCKALFKNTNVKYDENTMFCIDVDEKGICSGDSGGPTVLQNPDNGQWTQVGINSFANGCNNNPRISGFMTLSAFVDFIKQNVEDL